MSQGLSPGPTPDLPRLPPPLPADNVLAVLRWIGRVLKASTGSNGAAIRRHHAEAVGGASLATVALAISSDLATLVAKAVVAALTGSVALVGETLHSFADTGTQLLLLKGLRRARRPDTRPPFRLWCRAVLLVTTGRRRHVCCRRRAVGLGGRATLAAPGRGADDPVGFCRARSRLSARRPLMADLGARLRRGANARGVPFRRHVRSTTDTAVTSVYYENSAALLGNAIALSGSDASAPRLAHAR